MAEKSCDNKKAGKINKDMSSAQECIEIKNINIMIENKPSSCWLKVVILIIVLLVLAALCTSMFFAYYVSIATSLNILAMLIAASTLAVCFVCATIMVVVYLKTQRRVCEARQNRNDLNSILLDAYMEIFNKSKTDDKK